MTTSEGEEDLRERLRHAEAALVLANDVLSRAPFSTQIWPNGMHPNRGISIIRDAIAFIGRLTT